MRRRKEGGQEGRAGSRSAGSRRAGGQGRKQEGRAGSRRAGRGRAGRRRVEGDSCFCRADRYLYEL